MGQDRAGVRCSVGAMGGIRVLVLGRGSVFALALQVQGRESGPSGRWGRVARRDSSVAMPETAVLDSCGGLNGDGSDDMQKRLCFWG